MSTGDEVTDLTYSEGLTGGMIRDSNRPSLISLLRSWNLFAEVADLGIARDTPSTELETKIRDSFRLQRLDIIVTTGGVSMGELDLLKPTIERSLGGEVHFGRVSMKPGKPTTFASVPFKESDSGKGDKETDLWTTRKPGQCVGDGEFISTAMCAEVQWADWEGIGKGFSASGKQSEV